MVALQNCPVRADAGAPKADEGTADEEAGGGGKEQKKKKKKKKIFQVSTDKLIMP